MSERLDSKAATRRRVLYVFMTQGLAGLLVMVAVTALRFPQTATVIEKLAPNATILVAIFVAFATALSLLKFELTNVIFTSLGMMAYMSMLPLLGTIQVAEAGNLHGDVVAARKLRHRRAPAGELAR